jgi:type II secretory pathway pseudopilin PulG
VKFQNQNAHQSDRDSGLRCPAPRNSGATNVGNHASWQFYSAPVAARGRRSPPSLPFSTFTSQLTRAFTLIEIMVVVTLMTVMILGLVAMFNQTQKAFKAGMTQVDVLEAGRMATDLIARELGEMTPSYHDFTVNFYAQIPNYRPLLQTLPASGSLRINLQESLYFLSRENQTWKGIGYFVRDGSSFYANPGLVGTLYRFETNNQVAQFAWNSPNLFPGFTVATNPPFLHISKILDGVVHFRIRTYDTNGMWMTGGTNYYGPNITVNNSGAAVAGPGEVGLYAFTNNAVPAYVEFELGILEPGTLARYRSIPDATIQSNFLASHAGNVHLFRQRIAIRNLDPSAYQ